MAFSEKLKQEVRMKSDVRCAVCRKPFVEVHHIVPQAAGGDDTFDNAVALCAYCHDIYGGNPDKRKQLKEIRDSWYQMVEACKTMQVVEKVEVYEKIKIVEKAEDSEDPMIAVYHFIESKDTFEDAVKELMKLTSSAQKCYPNKRRKLYLDIEGHRLKDGAFDNDMWELQYNFIFHNLAYYYTEINIPLASFKNKNKQLEDELPEEINIYNKENMPDELKKHEGSLLFKNLD